MEKTGERYLPEYDADWTLEHVHRYLVAREFVSGKDVLDIASGEGYGSFMLAKMARSVIGVDVAEDAVGWAQHKYRRDNLEFRKGSAVAIPLEDGSVDLVVSFETIEHLAEHDAMLEEIRRVLRPGGFLIMSSPDKYEYTDVHGFRNEYHVRELYRDGFEELLRAHFIHCRILSQRVVFGSVMGGEDQSSFLSWRKNDPDSRTAGLSNPWYFIAIAGDVPVPPLPCGVLKAPIEESDMARELSALLAGERSRLEDLGRRHAELEELYGETEKKLEETERMLGESKGRLREAESSLASIKASYSWNMTRPFSHMTLRLWKLCRK